MCSTSSITAATTCGRWLWSIGSNCSAQLISHRPALACDPLQRPYFGARGGGFLDRLPSRLEGIVSKRGGSHYVGRRAADWVKVKCIKRQEFVIGGWTEPEGARAVSRGLAPGLLSGPVRARLLRAGRNRLHPAIAARSARVAASRSSRRGLRFARPLTGAASAGRPLGEAEACRRSRVCRLDGRWLAPPRCLSGHP